MNHIDNSSTSHKSPAMQRWHRTLPFYILGIVALAISITFFVFSISRPYIGAKLELTDQGWEISVISTTGLAQEAGMKRGDRPIEINEHPSEEFLADYAEVVGYSYSRLISQLSVIDNDGEVISVSTEFDEVSTDMILDSVACLIVSLAFWIVGFYVFATKPANRAALLLYLLSLSVGLVLSATLAKERSITAALQIETITLIITPWLAAHLLLILPHAHLSNRLRYISCLLYLPAAMILLLSTHVGYENGLILPWFRSSILTLMGLGLLVTIIVSFYNYFRATSLKSRQQMQIVLISTAIGLAPFTLFSAVPEAVMNQTVIPPELSILAAVCIPLGMGYAIITRQLLDIDFVVRRSVVYAFVTVILGIILAIPIILLSGYWESGTLITRAAIALGIGITASILFGPIRRRTEALVDRVIFKDRFDYLKTIEQLSSSIVSLENFIAISYQTITTIMQTLNLSGGALLNRKEADNVEIIAAQGNLAEPHKQWQLAQLLPHLGPESEFPNPASNADPDVAFFVPLTAAGKKDFGMLALGPKSTKQPFSMEDMHLIQGSARVASAALRNSMLIDEVSAYDMNLQSTLEKLRMHAQSLEASHYELAETYIELARTLIKFLESRDSYTRGHSDRVAELAKLTARELGLSADETVPLERAALFHDIGKVAIADDILRKPHDLHPAEMEQVQRHVEYGIDILSNLTFLNDSLPLIESHHERYDGTGYPRGLAGEDIPLGARIIAVIDAFDAITSERPYRPASSRTEAIEILRNGAGTQWCPQVVDTFLHVLEKTLEKD